MRGLWRNQSPYVFDVHGDLALLIGRILITIELVPNGLRKLADFAALAAAMGGSPQVIGGRLFPDQEPLLYFPYPALFLAGSIACDILGATLVIAGVKTRAIAALLCGYVLLAVTIYHSDVRGPEDLRAILRVLPLLGGLVILAGLGAGRLSADGWLARRRRAV